MEGGCDCWDTGWRNGGALSGVANCGIEGGEETWVRAWVVAGNGRGRARGGVRNFSRIGCRLNRGRERRKRRGDH